MKAHDGDGSGGGGCGGGGGGGGKVSIPKTYRPVRHPPLGRSYVSMWDPHLDDILSLSLPPFVLLPLAIKDSLQSMGGGIYSAGKLSMLCTSGFAENTASVSLAVLYIFLSRVRGAAASV